MTAERKILRTLDEIRAAGAEAAAAMSDLTESEARKVLELLAPYREQLIKWPESGVA